MADEVKTEGFVPPGGNWFGNIGGNINDSIVSGIKQLLDKAKCDGEDPIFAVQFQCGECVKKVLHVADIDFFDGVAVLTPRRGHFLVIKLFCDGKLTDKQLARAIVVPIERICSVEVGAIEIEHCHKME